MAMRHEKFLACVSSNEENAKTVIRKTARLASYYNAEWWVLYVETPEEGPQKIPLDKQRFLINNFKLATELGAEVIRISNENIARTIANVAEERGATTICIGKPRLSLFKIILVTSLFNQLLNKLSESDIDLIILS
jgi:two-component system sensor histidine kinase KdpD